MLRYSRAYPPEALREFETASAWIGTNAPEGPVFLWDDLTLTADAFAEQPAYRDDTEEWRSFCREQLQFAVPDDLG